MNVNKVIRVRMSAYDAIMRSNAGYELPHHKVRTGRDHAPSLSITDDMPEAGGGGASAGATDGPDVSASDDDDGGDDDGEPARRRAPKSSPSFPPALFGFAPLSHYVGFGRSRIYQLIGAGEFPPPLKIGKSSRWVKAEIDAWIASHSTTQRAGR